MSKQADRQLRDLLKKGGELSAEFAESFSGLGKEAELAWCEADCSKARNRSALFRAVVKAVDYPQFFGGSFEGLYDCLTDTIQDQKAGLVLVFKDLHSADPDIERDLAELQQILNDVVENARETGRVFVFCIEHGGKHPDDLPGVAHHWSED